VVGVASEALERGGGGLKEEAVDELGVALGERVQGVVEGEDRVEVFDGEQLAAAGVEPAFGGQTLALGAVAVATRNGELSIPCLMGSDSLRGVHRACVPYVPVFWPRRAVAVRFPSP
jgi:hypothetical protein